MKKYRIKSREEMVELHDETIINNWNKEVQAMLGTIQEGEKDRDGDLELGGFYWGEEEVEEIEEEIDFSVSSIKDDNSFSIRIQGSTIDAGILTDNKDDLLKVTGTKEYKLNMHGTTEYTDKHYDFTMSLTPEETNKKEVRLDPYKVAKEWRLGEKDDTGCLFHLLKTIARYGDKNPTEREIKALKGTINRLEELNK